MSDAQRATDLREALLAETLDEVARLYDSVQAIGPTLQAAIAEAATQGKNEVHTYTQEQTYFVEQTMLRDREKFVTEQKAALEALDTSLRKRDAGIVKIMADILEKARATLAQEMTQAIEKYTNQRPKKEKKRAALGALALGVGIGAMGTMGGLIILLRLGVVGVVGAGQ